MDIRLYFFTATILEWKKLLFRNNYKDIIISSMKFLVDDKRVKIYSFVIMPNHIHIVWKILEPHILHDVQRDFMKYTAQQLKFELTKNNSGFLEKFLVNAADRKYQIWERNPLSVELVSLPVIEQKINYIHANPVRANLVKEMTDYEYSSAEFYYNGHTKWEFLSHYMDED